MVYYAHFRTSRSSRRSGKRENPISLDHRVRLFVQRFSSIFDFSVVERNKVIKKDYKERRNDLCKIASRKRLWQRK